MLKTLAAVALATVGCVQYPARPDHAATDFIVEDPKLAAELEAAAADWADAGLVLANYVTINQVSGGVPVIFMTREELRHNCNFDPKKVARKDPRLSSTAARSITGAFSRRSRSRTT